MNGYVMNISPGWVHAMKRSIGPGEKIDLMGLYEQYGKKHEIADDETFVTWLKSVKLKNSQVWKIVYIADQEEVTDTVVSELSTVQEDIKVAADPVNTVPVRKEMTIKDVVMLSVRQGREMLPKITDLKLLKYAFQEANQLAGKDSLCNLIRKRIKDLELGR